MRFFLRTFGCKSNQYESQAIREALNGAGHDEAAALEEADVLILNSCGVTGRAGASCRSAVRKASRLNPGIRVVITGCGVDLEEKWPEIPTPVLLVSNAKKHALPRLLDSWKTEAPDNRFGLSISCFSGHTRAFLKIQDGCDNFCSYCAVPRARGKPESREPGSVLDEAKRLIGNGHAEIVLTGINIGAYRHSGVSFPELVERISRTPGLARLRLGSVEPPYVTEELAAAMRANAVVCPHLHLPAQSGDDGILAAMGRRYSSGEFLDKVGLLHSVLSRPAVTTDIIVGFPGEDEAAFAGSVRLCEAAGFSRLHVFPFSPRPGTPAASMPRRTPERTVRERHSRLTAAGRVLAERYACSCVGLEERVIVEERGAGLSDRYVRLRLRGGAFSPGSVVAARVTEAEGGELAGIPLSARS